MGWLGRRAAVWMQRCAAVLRRRNLPKTANRLWPVSDGSVETNRSRLGHAGGYCKKSKGLAGVNLQKAHLWSCSHRMGNPWSGCIVCMVAQDIGFHTIRSQTDKGSLNIRPLSKQNTISSSTNAIMNTREMRFVTNIYVVLIDLS